MSHAADSTSRDPGMPERQAIHLLLIRAVEEEQPDLIAPEAQSGAAIAALDAPSDRALLERRAAYLYDHLPAPLKSLERVALLPEHWIGRGLATTFAIGLLANYLGPSGHFHVVYNPVVLLILWNFCVYAALLWAWQRHARRRATPASTEPARSEKGGLLADAWFRINGLLAALGGAREAPGRYARILNRFRESYWRIAGPIVTARITYLAHLAAIGLVTGAIAGAYLRGLFFEYNAVWESTFIHNPAIISVLLNLVMGPAELLRDGSLISVSEVRPLLTHGGVPAAIWIHRLSLTALLLIILPRTALLIGAARRAWGNRGRLKVGLSGPYFIRTLEATRERQTHRIRDEITTLMRLEAGKLAEGAAVLVREKFFDRLVAPTLITFRNQGGRIGELESEIAVQSARFEPDLTAYLASGQRQFRDALQAGIRQIVGAQLAAMPGGMNPALAPGTGAVGRDLAGAIAGDIGERIGNSVTAAVAAAIAALGGGVGKTVGMAILATLLGTTGPLGVLLGGIGALAAGGGTWVLGRKRLGSMARRIPVPALIARMALRDSRISRARVEVYQGVKRHIEEEFVAQIPRMNAEILRALSAAIARRD